MAKNIFLGALPSYDGGYRDTPEGDEGTIPTYTPRTSDVVKTDALPSPMYQQTYTPPPTPTNYGQPQGGSESKTSPTSGKADVIDIPESKETPILPDKPVVDKDIDNEDSGTNFKFGLPLIIVGASILFFFLRKKK